MPQVLTSALPITIATSTLLETIIFDSIYVASRISAWVFTILHTELLELMRNFVISYLSSKDFMIAD